MELAHNKQTADMDHQNDKEMDMIRAAQDIGRIAEMNCHATASLTNYIERKGKDFRELSIREALLLVEEWHTAREAMYRSASL